MAITNDERVGKTMELLKAGLAPFVERECKQLYKGQALVEAQRCLTSERLAVNRPFAAWDAAVLLRLMWDAWHDVFRKTLAQAERSLVSELRDVRNRWAHQEPFSGDDTDRALDSAERLLTAVSAPQADEIRKVKMELRRTIFDEQARNERRRSAVTTIDSAVTHTLKPWREVVTPHRDVASGGQCPTAWHRLRGARPPGVPRPCWATALTTGGARPLFIPPAHRSPGIGGGGRITDRRPHGSPRPGRVSPRLASPPP